MKEGFVSLGLVAGALLLMSGCASMSRYGKLQKEAQLSYVKGDYDTAVEIAAKSIRINPNYDRSKLLIRTAFPNAIDSHIESIDISKRSRAPFKWDKIVADYEALSRLNKLVKSLPPLVYQKAPVTFDLRDYTDETNEARQNAAEEHYQAGVRLFGKEGISNRDTAAIQFSAAMRFVTGYKDARTKAAEGYYQEGVILAQVDNINTQKRAAKAFTAAQSFVPDYKDARTLYERSRKAGIKRIAFIPFEDKSGKGRRYGAIADAIVDSIISDVINDRSASEFLEIVSRDQLSKVMSEQKLSLSGIVDMSTVTEIGGILGVHEILTGKITQITVTPEKMTTRRISHTERVRIGREKYNDNGKIRERSVYGEVSAYVNIYKRTAGASISGSYKIIDVKTAKLLNTKQFRGTYTFEHEWASFSGDQRALSKASRYLLNVEEKNAPVGEEMINQAKNNLVRDLSATLKRYAQ